MNALVNFVGFVHEAPCVQEASDGTPTALVRLDVYNKEGKDPAEIPLRFVGAAGVELALAKLEPATFVEVTCSVANMRPGRIGDFRFPSVIFDVDALQVINRPDLSEIPSVEDFVRMYSQEGMTFRALHGKAPSRRSYGKNRKPKGDKGGKER